MNRWLLTTKVNDLITFAGSDQTVVSVCGLCENMTTGDWRVSGKLPWLLPYLFRGISTWDSHLRFLARDFIAPPVCVLVLVSFRILFALPALLRWPAAFSESFWSGVNYARQVIEFGWH